MKGATVLSGFVCLSTLAILAGGVHAETLVLQEGAGGYSGCKDSWLRTWYGNTNPSATYIEPRNQHDNYGAADALDIRYYYSPTCPKSPKIGRVVIGYNLSSIPAGSTIIDAFLQMKVKLNLTAATMVLRVYRITSSWEEDQVSWLDRTASDDWSEPGGDYIDEIIDAQDDEPVGSWVNWDVTEAVKDWKEMQSLGMTGAIYAAASRVAALALHYRDGADRELAFSREAANQMAPILMELARPDAFQLQ